MYPDACTRLLSICIAKKCVGRWVRYDGSVAKRQYYPIGCCVKFRDRLYSRDQLYTFVNSKYRRIGVGTALVNRTIEGKKNPNVKVFRHSVASERFYDTIKERCKIDI